MMTDKTEANKKIKKKQFINEFLKSNVNPNDILLLERNENETTIDENEKVITE